MISEIYQFLMWESVIHVLNLQMGYELSATDLLSTHNSQFLLFLKLIPTESPTITHNYFHLQGSGVWDISLCSKVHRTWNIQGRYCLQSSGVEALYYCRMSDQLTLLHSMTSQKTWILNNNAEETSNLTYVYISYNLPSSFILLYLNINTKHIRYT